MLVPVCRRELLVAGADATGAEVDCIRDLQLDVLAPLHGEGCLCQVHVLQLGHVAAAGG